MFYSKYLFDTSPWLPKVIRIATQPLWSVTSEKIESESKKCTEKQGSACSSKEGSRGWGGWGDSADWLPARCCFGPVLLSWKVSLVIWAVVTDLRILGYDVLLSAIITVICDLLPKHCWSSLLFRSSQPNGETNEQRDFCLYQHLYLSSKLLLSYVQAVCII